MKLISINEIIIKEDRIRKEFDNDEHISLASSIFQMGLFHAPVVQSDGVTLISGERRIRAIQHLYSEDLNFYFDGEKISNGKIPIISLEDLSFSDIKEAELDENLKRKNLHWKEEAEAISALHFLRKDEAEREGRKYYVIDTVRELMKDFGLETQEWASKKKVRNALIIAENLENVDVKKAKNEKEAIKIIEKKSKREYREKLSREFDLKNKSPHTLIHSSLFDELEKMEDETFDVIIADPPYGIDANSFANQGATKHSYNDDLIYHNKCLTTISSESFRIAKEKAHIYVFCDILRFLDLASYLKMAGWDVFRTPLIWNKGPAEGLLPRPEHGPRRTYEAIAFGIKGNKKTTGVFPDVISINAEQNTDISRGARKPSSLYKNLLNRSTLPGDKVLDPCCGTGPIFAAASELKLIATGIEIDDEAVGYCKEKLNES